MNTEPYIDIQLPLFAYGEPAENLADLLPVVWNATEALSSPDVVTRQHGIDTLLELGAQRASPLVGFMMATCITDPDIYIRRRVVYILADLVKTAQEEKQVNENIRITVNNYLHNMGEGTLAGILEVAVMDPQVDQAICQILNQCPYAGRYLGEILSDWKNPLPIRQKAIHFVGLVGYTEALPVLERLLDRLEARQTSQYAMSFASSSAKSDEDILPYLRIAIGQLNNR
jgi:hypothetical protein